MKRIFYIIIGSICLVAGSIGTFLPVLPTTPFLLLSLFCFSRGSKKIEAWFISTGLYKKYLSKYMKQRALPLKQKLLIQITAGIMMTLSFILVNSIILRIILILLFLIQNYVFIFVIKTYRPDDEKALKIKADNFEN